VEADKRHALWLLAKVYNVWKIHFLIKLSQLPDKVRELLDLEDEIAPPALHVGWTVPSHVPSFCRPAQNWMLRPLWVMGCRYFCLVLLHLLLGVVGHG